ncbi:MAG TPA: 16S rRNA (uracil(1498)-N(3))-methyltransferase [Patescibacteria group bacterium]|nr:16S rRNA (uracil(1498)-N(3))-methyltransferase [Patescibacteria group bacterium]
MSYFLTEENLEVARPARLKGEEAAHLLLSRRIKPGEIIKAQGPDGRRFFCRVAALNKREVEIVPAEPGPIPPPPRAAVTLYQAVLSQAPLEMVLQKATELSVAEIVLFNAERTATKLAPEKFAEKVGRWRKILQEAAKQSERQFPPVLGFQNDLFAAIEKVVGDGVVLVFDGRGEPPRAGTVLGRLDAVIGPEGGWSPAEFDRLKRLPNVRLVSLGPLVLRADTAAAAALAVCQNLF